MTDEAGVRAALQRDQEATSSLRAQLRGDLEAIFAAAADVATDDEHDPEGATIAYERSRTQALIDQADAHLSDITLALQSLDAGTYGACVRCGAPIAPARLQARPAVRTCIDCAAR